MQFSRARSAAITALLFSTTAASNSSTPKNIGYVLFPSFQALDVFGPLDALNMLSWGNQLNLTLISSTLDPVSTKARSAAMNPYNSTFGQSIVPTHTFATAPNDLEVLFVPGGIGTRAPDINSSVEFVRVRYPSLKYLITVCTGAGIAASAGVLDGKNATTNKNAWSTVTALGPKTSWRAHARWIVDGNIWTSGGVSAGIDTTLAWVSHVWGQDIAEKLALSMEYGWHSDPSWDPFSTHYNLTDVINGVKVNASVSGDIWPGVDEQS